MLHIPSDWHGGYYFPLTGNATLRPLRAIRQEQYVGVRRIVGIALPETVVYDFNLSCSASPLLSPPLLHRHQVLCIWLLSSLRILAARHSFRRIYRRSTPSSTALSPFLLTEHDFALSSPSISPFKSPSSSAHPVQT